MNLIIVEAAEIMAGRVVLRDGRAAHISGVLKAGVGDRLRVGVAGGLRGSGEVLSCAADAVELLLTLDEDGPAPWCDLILAMPRPRVFKRLLPQIAAMGVSRLWVIDAARVEKCYFGSHWLRPPVYRPLLLEGLAQAGATWVPEVFVAPHWGRFVREDLPRLVVGADPYLAHPGMAALPLGAAVAGRRALLAVGPEGGWLDEELALLGGSGFKPLSLGRRILRSDTACISLLATLARHYDPQMSPAAMTAGAIPR